jgi:CelD/BcsL family acetyltransferase involved in cellulose biosynthesis
MQPASSSRDGCSAVNGQPELVRLGDPARIGILTRDWLDLASRMDETSYFQTPDWIFSWWETIAARPRTDVATWRSSSGRLEALVVLSREGQRLHRSLPLRLTVHVNAGSGVGVADHCGWLVPPGRRDEVCAWVSAAIGGRSLLVRSADSESGAPPIPSRARVVEVTACPRLSLREFQGAGGCSPGFRRQLQRFSRNLEREGVQFEWVPPGAVDEPLLTSLFSLHADARGRHGDESSFDPGQRSLHLKLIARSGPGRGPAAVVARRRGAIVGVLYGFTWKDTFAAYQSGWDTRWARPSLGSVLTYHAIRLAADHGAHTFDFLRGTESYKYRFGAVDRHDRTWLLPKGPAGALLVARFWARQRPCARSRAATPPSDYQAQPVL